MTVLRQARGLVNKDHKPTPNFLSTRASNLVENEIVKKIMVKRQNQIRSSSNPNQENLNQQNLPNIGPNEQAAKGSKI